MTPERYKELADAAVRVLGWKVYRSSLGHPDRYGDPEWNMHSVSNLTAEDFIKDGRTVLALMEKCWNTADIGILGPMGTAFPIPDGQPFPVAIAEACLKALGEIE